MAYYTLEAGKGLLARVEEKGRSGVPTEDDLTEAQSWADAEVNQFLVEMVGASNAATVIAAFVASTPPEVAAIAYLLGSAHIFDRYEIHEWGRAKKSQQLTSERLRQLATTMMDRIRKSGYVTTAAGALYPLSGKRKRGLVAEDPGVRFYGKGAADTFQGRTVRQNLQTLFLEANLPAPEGL